MSNDITKVFISLNKTNITLPNFTEKLNVFYVCYYHIYGICYSLYYLLFMFDCILSISHVNLTVSISSLEYYPLSF